LIEAFFEAFAQALNLVISGDQEVLSIAFRSLFVSGSAAVLSCVWSLPIAVFVGLSSFPGKKMVRGFFNSMIGIPTVALGLILFLIFSASGPLGVFNLLYSPLAIIIGQAILITPILVSFSVSALESTDIGIRDLARTLEASRFQTNIAVMRESFWGVNLAIIASFNRAFAELGIALMLGGNIRHVTRVLTTSIALETAKGDIAFSLALAIILITVVLSITLFLNYIRGD